MSQRKKTVIVGMSGGVDSSVTAALLKKRGYDVIGMTMQLIPKEDIDHSACCNLGAISDAKRVAQKLDIPHYTINVRSVFSEKVIDHFVSQYGAGYTPNPCVECNRSIKFDELLKRANDLGVDYVATGHYAKITYSAKRQAYRLKMGQDVRKDQSYFLYMLNSDQLARILMPLGRYEKSKVRQMALDFGLINADRPDSQEICFVGGKSYREFVEPRLKDHQKQPGFIVDTSGKILGQHQGLYRYTVGQRRGLGLSSPHPLFILRLDPKANLVVVGTQEESSQQSVHVSSFTVADEGESIVGRKFKLKTRYQMTPTVCKVVDHQKNVVNLQLSQTETFISPGQSAVIYEKDRVVGGGIIHTVDLYDR